MDQQRRELLVARVASGTLRLTLAGGSGRPVVYVLRRPTRDLLYAAQEVYAEHLYEAGLNNLYDEAGLVSHLVETGQWDDERQSLLDALPKQIEEFKLALFRANFRSNERKVVREALNRARAKQEELEGQRHGLDHLSAAGYAAMARSRFVFGCSLHRPDGTPLFHPDTFWDETNGLVEALMLKSAEERLTEAEYRELARTEPWRSVWSCRKAEGGVFGVPAADYTDEQRALACYSALYESINDHPDCPGDDIVADDDMLDGWLIEQKRQRQERQASKVGVEAIGNDRIRNAGEVFVVADTVEDAKKVVDMNDAHGKAMHRQRMSYLKEKGQVHEGDMPDSRRQINMQLTQMLSERMKG